MIGSSRGDGGRDRDNEAVMAEYRSKLEDISQRLGKLEFRIKLENLSHRLEKLERQGRVKARMEVPEGRHKSFPLDSPEGVSEEDEHATVDGSLFHRFVVHDNPMFSICEKEEDETPFSESGSEDVVVVDWDLPPVYDAIYPDDEGGVSLQSDGVGSFDAGDTSVVGNPIALFHNVHENRAIQTVCNLDPSSEADVYCEETDRQQDTGDTNTEFFFKLATDLYEKKLCCGKDTCEENYFSGIRGRILSNKGRNMSSMMEEYIVSIPVPSVVAERIVPTKAWISKDNITVLSATVKLKEVEVMQEQFVQQQREVCKLGQKLQGRRRIWLLAWLGLKASLDQRLVCAEYQDAEMELMQVTGNIHKAFGFVFDRGKEASISYGALKLKNTSCLLPFRISMVKEFVFDRGKAELSLKIYAEFIKLLIGAEKSSTWGG